MRSQEILTRSKLIPVITVYELETSVDLARALVKGGLDILELTLRTDVAIKAISRIRKELPQALVGAGTVINVKQLECVKKAGAQFAISPGLYSDFAKEARNLDLPLIPGVASAGELMLALEYGFNCVKFFPAEAAGGIAMLKALEAPFPQARFCPTGGIDLSKAKAYLALKNVSCVGGSWLTPKELVLKRDWDGITKLVHSSLTALES